MNHKAIAILGALVALSLTLLWLFRPSSQQRVRSAPVLNPTPTLQTSSPSTANQSPEEQRKAIAEGVELILSTPITFYGKVVDQHGDPVADADVGYSALDMFMKPGSSYKGRSDQAGLFSITGIKGARLSVNVRKNGYYFIDGKSNAAFAYGTAPDRYFREPPSRENPAIFVLHKAGATEPLIHVSSRTFRIPKDGTPVEIDLATGRRVAQGNFRVEAWTDDHTKDAKQRYNWTCRVTVPNGGLTERKEPFDFEAPLDGYRPSDELVMLQTTDEWQPNIKRDYFVKLPNNVSGRIRFYMIAQGDHFFEVESYLNPTPGSRKLEFDPSKVVKGP